ncbi:DNA-3-methyladenine glycosylase family protein [Streptomyces litchfieldiae]|uniref:DNA-3-methyladenine glycosylase 2 family protein n=1 Tax=Streptomyces litchfieldiae TaxID=3075543 RepID=A0ABU2MYR7_9ACTN|nr:DNA-3-methyladenine glycosylase 2 family protein [Streptomyces sp. DSM 44938]MDT0346802.1 DNA-3-methyladenine glycosylase 2 family protein [Streptomyces sp. DSM 44938]
MPERSWAPPDPYDLRRSLLVLRRGPYDPAFRAGHDGVIWRATRTPEGPATLRFVPGPRVLATAWGPGADWALDRLPALLGADDEPEAFVPHHRLVAESLRRHRGLRLIRTGLVLESLIPSILEQRVTTEDAYRAWRRLLKWFGEPAPGPGAELGMYVMPDAVTFARIPSWDWHRAGVDGKRSAAVVRAVRLARRMEEAAGMELPDALARLRAVPGIGPWTAAETLQRTNGAADAITVGDLHLPGIIGYALGGVRGADDERMLELLAPYAGQRYRAARLILLTGVAPARRAPRQRHANIARL